MHSTMNLIFLAAIVCCCGSQLTIAANVPVAADHSLMQFMLSSRALSQNNPQRSLECFDYYVPQLNAITEKYEIDYAACVDKAAAARSVIDASTQPERNGIQTSVSAACGTLNECAEHVNSIDYFECYVNAGSDNSKAMYAISANSSEILSGVRERYRLIDNDESRCSNAAERAYVENTATTYEELQSCLQGKVPMPTQQPAATSAN